jgi:integrase
MGIYKRGSVFQAVVRVKGHETVCHTFDTKALAEEWFNETRLSIRKGRYVSSREAEKTTLSEALDRYEREISSQKKGHRREKTRIKHWKNHSLGKRFLDAIRGSDIASYRDERLKGGFAPNTVRLELAVLSHLFEIARKEWGMESLRNPVKAVRLPSLPEGRDRRLKPGELEKLLEITSEEMGQVIRFALESGMRRGEITGMKWEQVDLQKKTVILPETKNGQKRIVPLSPEAVRILSSLPRRIDGNVWYLAADAVSQAFAQACHKADISGLRFHDLRHEATSRFFENGFNVMEVAAITGHKTLQMLKRYTHLKAEDLAKRMV